MEAVISTGGKQYRVTPGTIIAVEKLAGDKGAAVEFPAVFVNKDGEVLTGDQAARARVSGEVVGQRRSRKVEIVKFKRRKNYRRHRGHRQAVTSVRITKIEV